MCNATEGRGERGILACVFEEFTLRCKETWSRIIDGTCLLIMNLSSCYRLPLGKYYSNLSFPNHCFFFSSLHLHPRCRLLNLWELWIGLPPSWIRDDKWTLGKSLTHSQLDNMYEHVRRLWKPCDTMENDKKWKRHNRRDDERLLSGWGLETWNICTLLAAQIINLARVGQNKENKKSP